MIASSCVVSSERSVISEISRRSKTAGCRRNCWQIPNPWDRSHHKKGPAPISRRQGPFLLRSAWLNYLVISSGCDYFGRLRRPLPEITLLVAGLQHLAVLYLDAYFSCKAQLSQQPFHRRRQDFCAFHLSSKFHKSASLLVQLIDIYFKSACHYDFLLNRALKL